MAVLALGTPGTGFGVAASEPTTQEPGATALSVASDPRGAAVYVNGQLQGATPLTLSSMAPGEHRVRLVKDGYLENSRVVSVKSGQPGTVEVKMTPDREGTRYAIQQEPGEGGGGGGSKKALWIGLGVAAIGAGAYFLLRDTNDPPTAAVRIDAGGTALQGATAVSFDGSGSSDPDGDSLTYSWNFGDNATGSGQSTTHVYGTAGTFTVTLTVSDGEASVSATGTVNVRNLTGIWTGDIGTNLVIGFNLTQTGTSLTGAYADPANGSGSASGSVSAPRGVTLRNAIPGFRVGNWTGTVNGDVSQITGTVDWFTGGPRAFTLRRQ